MMSWPLVVEHEIRIAFGSGSGKFDGHASPAIDNGISAQNNSAQNNIIQVPRFFFAGFQKNNFVPVKDQKNILFRYKISKKSRLAYVLEWISSRTAAVWDEAMFLSGFHRGLRLCGTRRWRSRKGMTKEERLNAKAERRRVELQRLHLQMNLHPFWRTKRILGNCDDVFGKDLLNDEFLLTELANHGGWCELSTLGRLPIFQTWDTEALRTAFSGAEWYLLAGDLVRPLGALPVDFQLHGAATDDDWARDATDDDLTELLKGSFHGFPDKKKEKHEARRWILEKTDEALETLAYKTNLYHASLLAEEAGTDSIIISDAIDRLTPDQLDTRLGELDDDDDDDDDDDTPEYTVEEKRELLWDLTQDDPHYWEDDWEEVGGFEEMLEDDEDRARGILLKSLRSCRPGYVHHIFRYFAYEYMPHTRDEVVTALRTHLKNHSYRVGASIRNPFAYAQVKDAIRTTFGIDSSQADDDDGYCIDSEAHPDDNYHIYREFILSDELPRYAWDGAIEVAQTPKEVETVVRRLRDATILGFDVLKAKLDQRRLPAMVQLASPDLVALVWLDKLPDHGRPALSPAEPLGQLLEDEKVTKVGTDVYSDKINLELFANNNLCVRSYIHLEDLHPDDDGGTRTLVELTEAWLGKTLPKRKETPRINWRATDLTADMKSYAVNRTAATLAIFYAMERRGLFYGK